MDEWVRKPATCVSYGSVHGARGVEQLRQVMIELRMAPQPRRGPAGRRLSRHSIRCCGGVRRCVRPDSPRQLEAIVQGSDHRGSELMC